MSATESIWDGIIAEDHKVADPILLKTMYVQLQISILGLLVLVLQISVPNKDVWQLLSVVIQQQDRL